ncbi:MAG: hypothetical protein JXA95_00065 [Spirochaetales bacterium]|nr:hypothetical protein [Spirochaetales bacterium]
MEKPNLIYVMADQLRYHFCGYAGDSLAHTPNLDSFADSLWYRDNWIEDRIIMRTATRGGE